MHVDETRESILLKKEALEKTLKKWPFFRAGIASLAETWLELHRSGEALEVLNRFLILETKDPEIHYYVAMIYERQNNYPKAWFHLQQAEKLLKEKNHVAKPLKELRRELLSSFPE
jgi:tetratricopeptide (TPR) repeat protein